MMHKNVSLCENDFSETKFKKSDGQVLKTIMGAQYTLNLWLANTKKSAAGIVYTCSCFK